VIRYLPICAVGIDVGHNDVDIPGTRPGVYHSLQQDPPMPV